MTRICYVSRIFQTICKLFMCAKEQSKQETKRDISPG